MADIDYKRSSQKLLITPNTKNPVEINETIMSFDHAVQRFDFCIATKHQEDALDITGAEVLIALLYDLDDGSTGKYIDAGVVTGTNTCSYTVTDALDGYNGDVLLNVSLKMQSGQQIDAGSIVFHVKTSPIDNAAKSIVPEFGYYGYDEMIQKAQTKIAEDIANIYSFSVNADGDLILTITTED